MQPSSAKRIPAIDLVKIIAMVMVVGLHATYYFRSHTALSLSSAAYILCAPAIPLFFMASGYILLARPVEQSTLGYGFRKLWHIIRLFAVFTAVVYGLWYLFGDPSHSYLETLKYTILGFGIFYFLWFLLALALVYLLYPLINRLWHAPHGHTIMTVAALVMLFCGFADTLLQVPHPAIPLFLHLWYWVGYFILGASMRLIYISLRTSLAVTLLSAVAWIFTKHYVCGIIGNYPPESFYGCPVLLIFAIGIFHSCLGLKLGQRKWLDASARLFMPVYLTHTYVLSWLLDTFPWTLPGAFAGLWLSTLIISAILSWLLMRVAFIRRIFTL